MPQWSSRTALVAIAVVVVVGGAAIVVSDDDPSPRAVNVKPRSSGTSTTSTSTTTTTPFALPPAFTPTSGGGESAPPAPPAAPHVSVNATPISITSTTGPYTVLLFVKNDGTVPASVVTSGSGNFLSVVSRCSAPLAVGAQCQVDVVFDGASAPIGVYPGSVQVGAAGGNTIGISFTANDTT